MDDLAMVVRRLMLMSMSTSCLHGQARSCLLCSPLLTQHGEDEMRAYAKPRCDQSHSIAILGGLCSVL